MNYIIENRNRVYDDILEAVEHYYPINPELAEEFLIRLEEAKIHILNSPKGFEVKRETIRTLFLKQFPYHIYYILDGYKIIILAILHAQSGPEKINKI